MTPQPMRTSRCVSTVRTCRTSCARTLRSKRRLPFGFVSDVAGIGDDGRYMINVHPTTWTTWRAYGTPRQLLTEIGSQVHSGMYRTAPSIENADFYQVAVNRRGIRPGSIFYDPNGHVLVVAEVRTDGVVYLMDGHPDGSLTWKRFGEAFVTGTARLGGGFKNFRPLIWHDGRIDRAVNRDLPQFDARSQFDAAAHTINGRPVTYHVWVRSSLAEADAYIDPATEFREQIRALCRDVTDRADAVNVAVQAGLDRRAHPDAPSAEQYLWNRRRLGGILDAVSRRAPQGVIPGAARDGEQTFPTPCSSRRHCGRSGAKRLRAPSVASRTPTPRAQRLRSR